MRDFLNGVLAFLMTSYLTDLEFETVTADIPTYNHGTYDDLARILANRESVSDIQDRLVKLFAVRGVDVVPLSTVHNEIFIGAVL